MTWVYRSSDGELTRDGELVAHGYSGFGEARNNPALENMASIGPIPRGMYKIDAPRFSERLGPLVMNLDPVGHSAYGRTLFRIHGDNKTNDASHGCIILGPLIRRAVADSKDTDLEVI